MSDFNPKKLHVVFNDKNSCHGNLFPRKYTLTHSDITGELSLSIGPVFDNKKYSNLYSKLMRDEVLGEWKKNKEVHLEIYCHCSGGMAVGPAKWRESIFRYHMPLVLEAIIYGDRSFILRNKDLIEAPIYINFNNRQKKLCVKEKWGQVRDFMPRKV